MTAATLSRMTGRLLTIALWTALGAMTVWAFLPIISLIVLLAGAFLFSPAGALFVGIALWTVFAGLRNG